MKFDTVQWHEVPLSIMHYKSGRPITLQVATVGQPDTIYFMGMGSERRSQAAQIATLRSHSVGGVAVVAALPYWQVEPTVEAILELAVGAPIAVARYMRQQYNPRQLHVIAESQAAPGVLKAVLAEPALFDGRFGLLGPNGLLHLGGRQLSARLLASSLQFKHVAHGHRKQLGSRSGVRLVQDVWRGGAGLKIGLTIDIISELHQLYQARPGAVRVFSGEHDRLFPVPELTAQLANAGMDGILQVVPGTHASPSARFELNQLNHVLAWCRGLPSLTGLKV